MAVMRSVFALIVIFSLVITALGQAGQRAPQAAGDEDDAVVKVTTNLVQLDIVAVDKNGNPITDLRPDEFEIYEDGKLRKITNFSFIKLQPAGGVELVPTPRVETNKNTPPPPVPPARLRPEQVRRTFAFVIDDLGLSFEAVTRARDVVRKFVNQQMQPNDLVAIIRTGGGSGTLQQFTSDKQLLNAAIDRVKFNIYSRGGISDTAAINDQSSTLPPSDSSPNARRAMGEASGQVTAIDPAAVPGQGATRDEFDIRRQQFLTVGTLGSLKFIIGGMDNLPGRKALVLISDGFRIPSKPENQEVGNPFIEYLRSLTEQANRSAVTIYTIDGRGLQTLGLQAADSISSEIETGLATGPISGGAILEQKLQSALQDRRDINFETQSGLQYLSSRTGGFFTTDLNAGFNRVVNEQQGFYLIGYDPDEEEFNTRRGRRTFHKLTVKVKRSGVNVRSRAGFFGITDDVAEARSRTRGEKIALALNSPFGAFDLPVRLTVIYSQDDKEGSVLRSLVHIDTAKLSFVDEADGWHKAIFDLVAVTYGESGTAIDQVARTQTIRVRGETYNRILKDGFVYFFNIPVKQTGGCQVRVAVRDTASDRVGSASQFLKVPDLKEDHLALSGIVVTGSELQQQKESTEEASVAANLIPAVRKLRQGMVLGYSYHIYNSKLEGGTARVKTQMRLFQNGREVFAGQAQPIDTSGQKDARKLVAGGRLLLGSELPPGEYVLQVEVTDELAKKDRSVARQFIDFEIVK